jgi:hypothetical protein
MRKGIKNVQNKLPPNFTFINYRNPVSSSSRVPRRPTPVPARLDPLQQLLRPSRGQAGRATRPPARRPPAPRNRVDQLPPPSFQHFEDPFETQDLDYEADLGGHELYNGPSSSYHQPYEDTGYGFQADGFTSYNSRGETLFSTAKSQTCL